MKEAIKTYQGVHEEQDQEHEEGKVEEGQCHKVEGNEETELEPGHAGKGGGSKPHPEPSAESLQRKVFEPIASNGKMPASFSSNFFHSLSY